MNTNLKFTFSIFVVFAYLFIATATDDSSSEGEMPLKSFSMYKDKSIPLTNEEVAGIYKGEQDIVTSVYGNLNQAVRLELKENGTYSAKIFSNGEEMKNGLSPQNGTYSIDFEEDIIIEKDPYGEVTDKTITYLHTLTCNYQSQYGLRVSKYYISNNDKNQLRLSKSHNFLFRYPSFRSFISNEIDDYLVREEISLSFNNNEKKQIAKKENSIKEKKIIVNSDNKESDILGTYHGITLPYNMKNKYGDETIVNGKKITIPSIDYKFILAKEGSVSLQQTNLDDNTRYYYEGTFTMIDSEEKWTKLECSLSDGEYANPIYILTIWPLEDKALCQSSNNEPDIMLKKMTEGVSTLPNQDYSSDFEVEELIEDSKPISYIKINDPDGYTNVRSGKSSSTDIIHQIYDENKLFELIDDGENWWKIKINSEDNETKTGFIYYTKVLKVESFTVAVEKAYFHLQANIDSQNRAYVIKGDNLLCHSSIENSFRNCIYINSKGDTTNGYVITDQLK